MLLEARFAHPAVERCTNTLPGRPRLLEGAEAEPPTCTSARRRPRSGAKLCSARSHSLDGSSTGQSSRARTRVRVVSTRRSRCCSEGVGANRTPREVGGFMLGVERVDEGGAEPRLRERRMAKFRKCGQHSRDQTHTSCWPATPGRRGKAPTGSMVNATEVHIVAAAQVAATAEAAATARHPRLQPGSQACHCGGRRCHPPAVFSAAYGQLGLMRSSYRPSLVGHACAQAWRLRTCGKGCPPVAPVQLGSTLQPGVNWRACCVAPIRPGRTDPQSCGPVPMQRARVRLAGLPTAHSMMLG